MGVVTVIECAVVTVVCEKEVTVIEFHIGGLRKCAKFIGSGDTFRRWSVTVDFDDISLQKYGQFIIQSLLYSSVEFSIGGLRKCHKFIGSGNTFRRWSEPLLWDACCFWSILIFPPVYSLIFLIFFILVPHFFPLGSLKVLTAVKLLWVIFYIHVFVVKSTSVLGFDIFYTRPKSCFGGVIKQSGYLVFSWKFSFFWLGRRYIGVQ